MVLHQPSYHTHIFLVPRQYPANLPLLFAPEIKPSHKAEVWPQSAPDLARAARSLTDHARSVYGLALEDILGHVSLCYVG